VNPESLATYPHRIGPNRSNPYFLPGAYDKLLQGLEVFNSANCSRGGYPDLQPPSANFSADLRNRIIQFFYQGTMSGLAPGCKKQAPFTFSGKTTDYPQVREDPKP
jgi:hypothetical protein